jgi:hypothetical protein
LCVSFEMNSLDSFLITRKNFSLRILLKAFDKLSESQSCQGSFVYNDVIQALTAEAFWKKGFDKVPGQRSVGGLDLSLEVSDEERQFLTSLAIPAYGVLIHEAILIRFSTASSLNGGFTTTSAGSSVSSAHFPPPPTSSPVVGLDSFSSPSSPHLSALSSPSSPSAVAATVSSTRFRIEEGIVGNYEGYLMKLLQVVLDHDGSSLNDIDHPSIQQFYDDIVNFLASLSSSSTFSFPSYESSSFNNRCQGFPFTDLGRNVPSVNTNNANPDGGCATLGSAALASPSTSSYNQYESQYEPRREHHQSQHQQPQQQQYSSYGSQYPSSQQSYTQQQQSHLQLPPSRQQGQASSDQHHHYPQQYQPQQQQQGYGSYHQSHQQQPPYHPMGGQSNHHGNRHGHHGGGVGGGGNGNGGMRRRRQHYHVDIEIERNEQVSRVLSQLRKSGMDVLFPLASHDKVVFFLLAFFFLLYHSFLVVACDYLCCHDFIDGSNSS